MTTVIQAVKEDGLTIKNNNWILFYDVMEDGYFVSPNTHTDDVMILGEFFKRFNEAFDFLMSRFEYKP